MLKNLESLPANAELQPSNMKRILFGVAIILCASNGTRADVAREPRNLDLVKHDLRAYHEGEYVLQIAAVATQANAWLEQRRKDARPGERLAAVFDLDDTLLSGWPYLEALDFGYTQETWEAFVNEGNAPAMEPVLKVVQLAQKLGIRVYFLTSRQERFRAGTEKNLRAIGCVDYTALICAPNGNKAAAEAYKTAERKRLSAEGEVIILNLGDQESDLAGGYAERTFKLPNPFYIAP